MQKVFSWAQVLGQQPATYLATANLDERAARWAGALHHVIACTRVLACSRGRDTTPHKGAINQAKSECMHAYQSNAARH